MLSNCYGWLPNCQRTSCWFRDKGMLHCVVPQRSGLSHRRSTEGPASPPSVLLLVKVPLADDKCGHLRCYSTTLVRTKHAETSRLARCSWGPGWGLQQQ